MLVKVDYLKADSLVNVNREVTSSEKTFILANTVPGTLEELKGEHIIPVFVKDNEPAISQSQFIETVFDLISQFYRGERILKPAIRLSHPIKGRIPDAKDKPACQLQEWEKTIYYQRMMFVIEIPSITDMIDGNSVNLTIGGIKSYNEDNLNSKKGASEHFKLFASFQNKVCTNLCVWSDGLSANITVSSLDELRDAVQNLLQSYSP